MNRFRAETGLGTDSDRGLVDSIRTGDALAFEELYARYQQRVFAYLWRALRDEEAAADLLQEVFMRVWRARARWTPSGSVAGYLLRTARHIVIDEARKQDVRKRWSANWQTDSPILETRPDKDLHEQRIAARVRTAVGDLPDRMREVFSLKYDGGLSYQEISEQLGISVKTVEVHMSKALRRLRDVLGDLRGDG